MRERDLTFKEAVDDAIRAGMAGGQTGAIPALPAQDMGEPLVDIVLACLRRSRAPVERAADSLGWYESEHRAKGGR